MEVSKDYTISGADVRELIREINGPRVPLDLLLLNRAIQKVSEDMTQLRFYMARIMDRLDRMEGRNGETLRDQDSKG